MDQEDTLLMREAAMREAADELQDFADIEGTECGEYWECLISLARRSEVEGEFAIALHKELEVTLLHIDQEWAVETIEVERSPTTRTELVYKG